MPKVHLPQAGRVIDVPAGRTILATAIEQGIHYPHGCRSGRCGNCKSRLIEGNVELLDHSRFALSADEKAAGLILACRSLPQGDAAVAWLGDEEERAGHPERTLQARVVAVEALTHDIRGLRLVTEGEPLAFSAGQYARLTLPGALCRDYSMANRPGTAELEFHIRRVTGGATSSAIHERLNPGDHVTLTGPFGSSHLRAGHTGPILAVAGGSGLAPIKSVVETALALGMRQPIHVWFGARAERDLYLVDHFRELANRHPNLSFTPVLSEGRSGSYRSGYVSTAVAEDHRDLDGWKAYVAGPPAMVEATMEATTRAGLRSQDLHADVFFTPANETLPSSPAPDSRSYV